MTTETMTTIALSQFDILMSYRERIAAGVTINPDHLAELGGALASTVRVLQAERAVEKQHANRPRFAGIIEPAQTPVRTA